MSKTRRLRRTTRNSNYFPASRHKYSHTPKDVVQSRNRERRVPSASLSHNHTRVYKRPKDGIARSAANTSTAPPYYYHRKYNFFIQSLDDFINWTLVQMVLGTLIDLYLLPRIPGNLEDGLGNSLVLQYLSGYAVHGLCLSLYRVLTGRWFPPFGRLINVIFIFPLWTRVHVNGTVRLLVDYSWVGAPPYLATYHSRYKVASE